MTADIEFVEVDGHRLRVSVQGSGPPLLLVMGIGGNIEMWEPLRRRLNAETIAFDAPGTGASSTPLVPLRMSGLARLTGRLMDRLGYRRSHVLGVSFGGALAQQYARDLPARVNRLVLAATSTGAISVPGRPSALRILATPRRYYSRSYLERVAPTLYGGRIRTQPDLLRQQAAARTTRPPSVRGYAAQLAAVAGWTSLPWLHTLDHPTLVLTGDDDPIVPSSNARLLRWAIPGAELVVFRGGGHLFLLDSAEVAAPVIQTFLDGRPRRAGRPHGPGTQAMVSPS